MIHLQPENVLRPCDRRSKDSAMTVACSRRGSDTRENCNIFMRKQIGAVCLRKRGVERLMKLKFVFKNVIIVDCITMSLGLCHVITMEARVTSEARVRF